MPAPVSGLELIGAYRGSGLTDPPFLVRRPDGTVLQLSRLLYLILVEADGHREAGAIAQLVSRATGRPVSADNVRHLVDHRLVPKGLLGGGGAPRRPGGDGSVLALTFRRPLLRARAVEAVAAAFAPLFAPALVIGAVAAFVALSVWLLAFHGIGAALRTTIEEPLLILALMGAMVVSTAFHEVGHAAACRYGGARPAAMGAGLYWIWPAFYTDVTDSYRLGKAGRLRVDLGGVYFSALCALAAGGAYLATGFEPLVLLIVLLQLMILEQFTPWIRLDGYFVVSDATGVPDLSARIMPILLALLPGRVPDRRVTELKPWARRVVRAWALSAVLALLAALALVAAHAPDALATARRSLDLHLEELASAARGARPLEAALAALQVAFLALPFLGAALTAGLVGRRLTIWARRRRPALAGSRAASGGEPEPPAAAPGGRPGEGG